MKKGQVGENTATALQAEKQSANEDGFDELLVEWLEIRARPGLEPMIFRLRV